MKKKFSLFNPHKPVSSPIFLSAISILFSVIAIAFMCISDNIQGAIPSGRVIASMPMFTPGTFWQNCIPVYPPLHLYLIALAIHLTKNITWGPRIISVIFGAGLFFPYFYSLKIMTNIRIAAIASILLLFSPPFIIQSIISMPEVPYLFFIFLSLYFFLLSIELSPEKKLKYLFLCALSINLAFLLRYEGIIFVPIFSLLILKNKPRAWKQVFFFVLLGSFSCVIWAIINYLKFDNPLFFLTNSKECANLEIAFLKQQHVARSFFYANFFTKIFSWAALIGKMTLPFILILGVAGILRCLWKKRFLLGVFIFITLYLLFTIAILKEGVMIQERYALLLLLLLYPFTAIGLKDFCLFCFNKHARNIVLICLLVVFAVFSLLKTYQQRPRTPIFVKKIGLWLKNNLTHQDTILLDRDKWEKYYNNIILQSELPPHHFYHIQADFKAKTKIADKVWLSKIFAEKKVDYIFYASKGYLPAVMDIHNPELLTKNFNLSLEPVKEAVWKTQKGYELFRVYKIIYE